MLRDDLIVEMARRQTADPREIQAIRGMEWGSLRRQIPQIAECVRRGLENPEKDYSPAGRCDNVPQLAMLGQFLSAALGSICRQMELVPALVGGPSDVRDLILYRTVRRRLLFGCGRGATRLGPGLAGGSGRPLL